MNLKPTIAIVTATLALAGCGQQYETVGECKLAELKKLDQADESATEIVAEYCADYFAKIDEEEARSEAEEANRNRSVQLVLEPEWEEVWRSTVGLEINGVDLNSIAEGPNLVRSASVRKAESEEARESGDYQIETWILQCSRRILRVKMSLKYENNQVVDWPHLPDTARAYEVVAGTNGAALYNFVCRYGSPRNDPDLTA